MPSFIDLSGRRFGRLTVIEVFSRPVRAEHSPSGKPHDMVWKCHCDCGNETTVSRGNLKNGSTTSCGCKRNIQGGHSKKHPLWKRFEQMIDRCTKPDNKDFKHYGGRGISVCERWRSFPFFLEDMEASYFPGASLERKNNNGDYEPGNVRWATAKEQAQNRRSTVFINTPWGMMSRGEAAIRAGVPINRFIRRVKLGWSADRLFNTASQN